MIFLVAGSLTCQCQSRLTADVFVRLRLTQNGCCLGRLNRRRHIISGNFCKVSSNGSRRCWPGCSSLAQQLPRLYAEVSLAAGASAPLDPDQEERGIYVVEGELDIAGETFEGPRLLIFHPGDRITVRAIHAARMMFLGGAALEGRAWNFVSSRKERIEQAKEYWKTGRFTPVPGETKFIPLPEF
jgi:hypothetical protein